MDVHTLEMMAKYPLSIYKCTAIVVLVCIGLTGSINSSLESETNKY